MKVMTVFGTRPEAIKMAPLVNLLKKTEGIECIVCVTAQHRQMLDQVLKQFSITPDYDLDLMKQGQTLTSITSGILENMEPILKEEKPDLVLVHGDTTTSFAAALASFYQQIPVGHVEAGLRSHNIYSPFPEEMNRVMTGRIATLHFSPTNLSKENLNKENINTGISVTGNTVIDALLQMVNPDHVFCSPEIQSIEFSGKRTILLTAHRRENIGQPLVNICNAVRNIIIENDDVQVIFPMHLNPSVRKIVLPILSDLPRVHLIDPIEVEDMHNLIARCYLVMTDSGGLQEEAPALGKPVVVLRTETERPEVIDAGKAILAGIEENDIYSAVKMLLNNKERYNEMSNAIHPYGDGHASQAIVEAILAWAK